MSKRLGYAADLTEPLLHSKLNIPRHTAEVVQRVRLIERLDKGQNGKLTIICAPAGFGKTTLVSEWIAHRSLDAAWVSLDSGDNAGGKFWRYMASAIDSGVSYVTYDPINEPLFTGNVDVLVRYKAGSGYEAGETASFCFTVNPSISSVSSQPVITVVYGTPLAGLGLPAETGVTLSDGSTVQSGITWDGGNPPYNGNRPGTYIFTGTLSPPIGVTNPSGKTAMMNVTVAEEAILLTGIEADPASYRLKVGMTHTTVIQALYSDGSRITVVEPVTFRSSNADIATVRADGLVTGVTAGSASITALFQGYRTVISVEVWMENSSGGSGGSGGGGSSETSPDTSQTMTTTCSGGQSCTASYGDEVHIELPANLTTGNFVLTIQKITPPEGIVPDSMILLSPVFELLKSFEGSFKEPVTLRFKYQANLLGMDRRAGLFYYDETNGEWIEVEGQAENNHFAAAVRHFTKFAVFSVAKAASPQEKPEKPLTPDVHFNDVKGHWAEAMIKESAANGIVSGYADGSFKPDELITRAEFTVMLMRMLVLKK